MSRLSLPKYVGYYTINSNVSFFFQKKPNLAHRIFTKLLLGWEWRDYE